MPWKPGQSGNPQGSARPFLQALKRAIAQDDGVALRKAADQLLLQASAGEQWAVKELADRLDGKAKQQIALENGEDGPFRFEHILRQIVDPVAP